MTRKGGTQYPAELKAVIPLLSLAEFKAGAVVPLLVSQQDRNKIALSREGEVATSDIHALMDEQLTTSSPSDPSKIVLALPAEAADLKQTFGY
ncbi:hypothetical protein SAMN04487969_11190 [Paenibacillus algorifonticola]|uniref:Uncharacterized protein n=1 Tax=Paenibacillus algorifonticola TaxID=684063 RepID=A0A1I2F924_9BACL|nr:hypothetical protein [Paenibacillus algorifonticola]SFF01066.1 hypothetical protein SAMN04487969_11190 [Paenibacillus algorifonticola]